MRGLIGGAQSIVSAQSVPLDYPASHNWGGQQTVSSLGGPYVYVSAPPGGVTYTGSDLVNLMNVSGKSNY